jgi:hypothetical protein
VLDVRHTKASTFVPAVVLTALILALPVALDRIATASLRSDLQAVADRIAVATLFALDMPDEEALRLALAANGVDDGSLVSSLRRYEADGGRASEVVISRPVRSPISFLFPGADPTLEVTGRAITWR